MKKPVMIILIMFLVLLLSDLSSRADTFTNQTTGQVLHGYIVSQNQDGTTKVATLEKGETELNLTQWHVAGDRLGRNNQIVIITLDTPISLEIETAALEKAIEKASAQGPLFILFEVDTPGGRTDFARRICATLTQKANCPVVSFIKGGEYGGALSAGAALVFACDKSYIADNTVIGAATAIGISDAGQMQDLEKTYGGDIGEKISSAWRGYLASLAEQNNRPGLLARAMVDRNIEVIEIENGSKRLFIDPVNKRGGQDIIHTWSRKGSLLTLTAAEAVKCGIADKIANSRNEIVVDMNAVGAKIIINDDVQRAGREFRKAKLKFNKLRKSLDLKGKQIQTAQSRPRVLKILRGAKRDYATLIKIAKRYPDLQISVQTLESELNSVEAIYQDVKIKSKRR